MTRTNSIRSQLRKHVWLSRILVLLIMGLLAGTLAIVILNLSFHHVIPLSPASVKPRGIVAQRPVYDETPVSDNLLASYRVAPDAPRYLIVPNLGIKARVLPMGVTASGEIDAPQGIYDTGWYTGSPKPGATSQMATFIDGHVSGYRHDGVFAQLSKLRIGDELAVQLGNDTSLRYRIVKSETQKTDQINMATALQAIDPGKPGLNIMTCAGPFDAAHMRYNERHIIYTTLVQ